MSDYVAERRPNEATCGQALPNWHRLTSPMMESCSVVVARAFSGEFDMQIDPARAARWRARANEYRTVAGACISPGAQFAYLVLAESADELADRIEQGRLTAPGFGPVQPVTAKMEYRSADRGVSRRA